MNKNFEYRPLSPHITVHKKVLTSLLSIIHRLTGLGLSLGSVCIVAWIFSIAMGGEYFNIVYFFLGSFLGKTILFFWSFGTFYHLINGIRYLIWSMGYGIELKIIYRSGYLVIFLSIIFTILLWATILGII